MGIALHCVSSFIGLRSCLACKEDDPSPSVVDEELRLHEYCVEGCHGRSTDRHGNHSRSHYVRIPAILPTFDRRTLAPRSSCLDSA